jgi:hypothetical protein
MKNVMHLRRSLSRLETEHKKNIYLYLQTHKKSLRIQQHPANAFTAAIKNSTRTGQAQASNIYISLISDTSCSFIYQLRPSAMHDLVHLMLPSHCSHAAYGIGMHLVKLNAACATCCMGAHTWT